MLMCIIASLRVGRDGVLCPCDLMILSEKIHDPYAKSAASTRNGTAVGGTY
jgi:hypothetical protein